MLYFQEQSKKCMKGRQGIGILRKKKSQFSLLILAAPNTAQRRDNIENGQDIGQKHSLPSRNNILFINLLSQEKTQLILPIKWYSSGPVFAVQLLYSSNRGIQGELGGELRRELRLALFNSHVGTIAYSLLHSLC